MTKDEILAALRRLRQQIHVHYGRTEIDPLIEVIEREGVSPEPDPDPGTGVSLDLLQFDPRVFAQVVNRLEALENRADVTASNVGKASRLARAALDGFLKHERAFNALKEAL